VLCIAIESGYIIALLRNHTIHIHTLSDLEKPVQTVSLESSFGAFSLSYSPYGMSVRDVIRDERMGMASMLLLGGKLAPSEPVTSKAEALDPNPRHPTSKEVSSPVDDISPAAEQPPSGSGLTPPSSPPPFRRQPITPTRSSSLLQATAPTLRGPFSTTTAETLIIGLNGIQSFAPTPIVLRLDKLCAERKLEEAMALVNEERRKGRRGEIDGEKVGQSVSSSMC